MTTTLDVALPAGDDAPVIRGIEPELAAEIAARRAAVEQLERAASQAKQELIGWTVGEWLSGRGSAQAVADCLGVSRAMLYRYRDDLST